MKNHVSMKHCLFLQSKLQKFKFFDPSVRVWHGCQAQVLGSRLKVTWADKPFQNHVYECGSHARPVCLGLPDPCLGLTTMSYSCLGMINMPNFINNKQRGQLCTLVVRRNKRKKKCKHSIIDDNPTIICLHVPHHV